MMYSQMPEAVNNYGYQISSLCPSQLTGSLLPSLGGIGCRLRSMMGTGHICPSCIGTPSLGSYMPGMPNVNVPNAPDVHLPNVNIPSMPNVHMPSMPNVHMPSMPNVHMPNMPNLPNLSSIGINNSYFGSLSSILPTVILLGALIYGRGMALYCSGSISCA